MVKEKYGNQFGKTEERTQQHESSSAVVRQGSRRLQVK